MSERKLTTAAGAPVADNQNSMTAGPRGPVALQDDRGQDERGQGDGGVETLHQQHPHDQLVRAVRAVPVCGGEDREGADA